MSDLWDNRPLLPIVHPCATQGPQLRSPQRHSCLRFRNRGGDKSIWARACRVQARENPKKFGAAVGGKAGPCRGCCCGGVRRLTVAAVCVREVPGSASSGLPGVAVLPQPCGGSRWPQCPRQPTQLTVGEFSRCLTPLTDVYLFTYSQKSHFLPDLQSITRVKIMGFSGRGSKILDRESGEGLPGLMILAFCEEIPAPRVS